MTATTSKFQTAAVARALLAEGITAASHHMQVKSTFRRLLGYDHGAAGVTVQDLRDAMTKAAARATKAPRTVHHVTLAELPKTGKWGRVVRIVAWGRKGQPKRVVIRCECGTEREIATQDLFQVRHCSLACKRAATRVVEQEAATQAAQRTGRRRKAA